MSTAFNGISANEYLAMERQATVKSEYHDGEVFVMSGGTPHHALIAANFIGEAGQALKDKPCITYTSNLRVKVDATGLYTYPDATIVCDEAEYDDDQKDTVVNPAVIVEVLSKSTESYDRGRKSAHYRQIESLQEIILISQDEVAVERYVRQSSGWLLLEKRDLNETLDVTSVGIEIAMSELYRDVKFESPSEPFPAETGQADSAG